ncbi:ABC transporter substrate-binding protein [Actinoallomurus soli]|uniref:ABC transporter substrate-binding protein n=1 Tax=Actinoallomurus soli TaxID=2952535 RepID=UPI002091F3F3|nr:ABC transporter substrate-binding protein [Actinoallomurus soli]MCO5969415.1 ABC transporter substrate-binding protein [Actinoallomurus soli]
MFLGALAVAGAVALGACSSGGGSSASTSTAAGGAVAASGCTVAGVKVDANPALKAKLPAAIRDSGQLTVATAGDSPPYTYKDSNGRLTGLEIDMARALGCRLGMKIAFRTIGFSGILTGIQAGRFTMGMSTISDTSEREKVLNFVSYQTEGTAIIVPKGNPDSVTSLNGLCGHSVAVTQGSISQQLIAKQSARCSSAIKVTPLPTAAEGYLAVRNGRADAFLDTFGTAVYTSKHGSGTGRGLQVVTQKRYGVGYQAVALPKNADGTTLTHVIADTFDELITSGAYGALYQQAGLTQNELPKVAINDAAKYEGTFLDIN